MSKIVTLPMDLIRRLYEDDHIALYRLAETYNCSPTTIAKRLKAMGVDVHNRRFDRAKNLNIDEIVHLYVDEGMTTYEIAALCKVNKTSIARRLKKAGVELRSDKSDRKFSDEELLILYNEKPRSLNELGHILGVQSRTVERRLNSLGIEPPKCDIDDRITKRKRYMNMQHSSKWDIPLEWFLQFDDIDKLMFLNTKTRITGRGYHVESAEQYKEFIEHFYHDQNFNDQYSTWKQTGAREDMPSLDHIDPRTHGGDDSVENLAFVSWFENRAKNDLNLDDYLDCVERYYGSEARRITEKRYGVYKSDE